MNKYGVSEVVDYIADTYEFGQFVKDQISDGVQPVADGLALYGQREQITEFIEDWPVFLREVQDIEGDEPQRIVDGVRDRLNMRTGDRTKVHEIIIASFTFGAAFFETYRAGERLVNVIKA